MSAETPARARQTLAGDSVSPRFRGGTLGRFGSGVFRQTLMDPIAEGRLRNVDWPFGLLPVVVAGYAMFGLAGLTVMLSGLVRQQSTLLISGPPSVGMPEVAIWPLVVMLSFGTASLLTAALHGPGWLRILGLLFVLAIAGIWSLRRAELSGGPVWLIAAVVIMVALVVFVIVRSRRRFAWWEFGTVWALVGAVMVVGIGSAREAQRFGFQVTVRLLQQTTALLGFLALPAAMVAGASVAEITIRASVAATRHATRLAHRRWPLVILLVVLAARGFQLVREWLGRDPVSQGAVAYVPALAIMVGFSVIGFVLVRLSRRTGDPAVVSELGGELSGVGFGIAAALVAVLLPAQLLIVVLQTLASLDSSSPAARFAVNPANLIGDQTDPIRILIGVVLIVLAVRAGRRGRTGRALVLGCVAIMLIALARNLVLGDTTAAPIDPDVLNSVATGAVLVAIAVTAARRRLTGQRAIAFAGILILSALFSSRDFVSDPLGLLLGFSGAALVLFGLTWDLLTGSHWGNGDSRRFPRPTRVMLVLTNSVLTMTVLAYAALVRDGSTTIYLDPYAEFGNLIFGTGLLAAAVIAVFDAAWRNAPVD